MSKNGGRIANGGRKNQKASFSPQLGPVFIYSGYRSSSTWLWDKFRQDSNACAYYEPFNPILGSLRPEDLLSSRPDTWRSHHPNGASYMTEYAPLLGTGSGLALFPKGSQDGERYIGKAGIDGPLDPDIRSYVSNLVESARALGRVPVLSCTRMLGRAAGLSAAFGGCHILLVRNLFQQWCSYSGQLRFGNDYFFRTLYDSLENHKRDEFVSFLRGIFSNDKIDDFHVWMKQDNTDLVFCYFCAFQIYFMMGCRRHADIVIDVNKLARLGKYYQEEIADQVYARTGLQIILSDVRERIDYPAHLLKSPEDCRLLLRAMIDRLPASEVRNDEDRNFVEALLTDLWDEYDRFIAATSGAAEVIACEAAKKIKQADLHSEAQALLAHANARLAEIEVDTAAQIEAAQAQAAAEVAEAQALLAHANARLAEIEADTAAQIEAAKARAAAEVAEAKNAFAQASSKLDAAVRELADQRQRAEEQARRHAATVSAADDQIAVIQSALAAANDQLVAAQRDHLALALENGRLEGQLTVQTEATSARIADASAFRQELLNRLSKAERAIAAAQADASASRDELAICKRDHRAALAEADARFAELINTHAAVSRENGRLSQEAAVISRQLTETILQHEDASKNIAELSKQRDGLVAELEGAQQKAEQHIEALQSEIACVRDHIAWLERQLDQATILLTAAPRPLKGLPRLFASVVRTLLGSTRMAAIANHEAAVANWGLELTSPKLSGVRNFEDSSLVGNDFHVALEPTSRKWECMEEIKHDGPITNVPDLLAPHDLEFIHAAYQAVLGRSPDPEGEVYYLTRLRRGAHKLAILKQLRRSPEGKAFIPGVAGLDRAIRRHVRATLPILGILFRLLRGDEGNGATHRSLRALANDVGRLRTDYLAMRSVQAVLTAGVREVAQSAFQVETAQARALLEQANARVDELERAAAFGRQNASVPQPAAEPHTETGTITEADDSAAKVASLQHDRIALPLALGSRTVYIYVEHTASCSTNTGVQRVTRGLAKSLLAQGERVRFVKWYAASQRCVLITAEERQHLARWNGPEVGADEHALYQAAGEAQLPIEPKAIGENNWLIVPEVTHITFQPQPVTLDLLTWAKRAGLKSGVVFYDAIPLRRPELDPVVPVHTRYMQQLLLADVVWPISDWAKRDLQAFWIGHEHADSATMPETYTLHLPGDSTISERVTLPHDGEPMILAVGSIEPRKNQVQLLKAFAAFREKNPGTPWKLVLVGNLHPAVAEEVAHATCVGSGIEHLGHVSDQELVDLYSRCAFTVFPSVEEGFGLPILESLWFGKPCVCADFGAMAEVANGGGCLQVDTRDVAALEGGIRKLIKGKKLRRSLAQQAVDRPILSWDDYAGAISAHINRKGQPGLQVGMVYFWIDATLEFSKNTGIQRVARQLARSMIAMGMRLVPVKWDATEGIGPVSAEELEFFSRWNGPSADAWHPWVNPQKAGAGAWFFMPELPLNRAPVERSRIIEVCHQYGLRKAAVFHDAIPWKMRDVYPLHYTEAHGAYMLELAGYDLVLPNSLSSGRDLLDFQGATLERPLGLTDKIKTVPLAGEFPESERILVGPALHGGPLRVLCVGTVEPRKNHETLLRAFEIASQRPGFDLQLTIVGGPHSIDPELPGRVRSFVASHPNITWEENADDARLRELYHQCDFTVYPSIEEGFGLPIVESLWNARPCICANFGAMAEVAEGGGCLTTDVRNLEAFADTLWLMASDQRLREDLVLQAITRPFKSWADYATEVAILMAESTKPASLPPPALLTPAEVAEYGHALRLQPRPKLSVCISTYNRAEWLSSSLRNWSRLYPQPLPDVELLVCDNASTDHTPDVVGPYLQRSDFRYHCNAQNVGMLGNLRETAHQARGEYIWIVGDDDLILLGAVERVLRAIDEHRDIALVYLNYAYTHENDARNVTDFDAFFAAATPIVPPEPDRYGPIREICARNENFFTAIYTLVFRRDHAIKAYSQDTSGRPFSSMPTCIPTTQYVLDHMMDAPGLWVGTPQIVVNMNVSWMKYAPLWILERIPEVYDRAEQAGVRAEDMDRWRAHTLPGVVHFFQDIYRDDPLGNGKFFAPDRLVRRFKHLPQFAEVLPVLESTYARAHDEGHALASRHPSKVFPKIEIQPTPIEG